MTDKTKAEAAAYAPEIELLTRAQGNLLGTTRNDEEGEQVEAMRKEIFRRLRILLGLEEK